MRTTRNLRTTFVRRTELAAILGVGTCKADSIAIAAGAKFKIGRRALYDVAKCEDYVREVGQVEA